MPLPIIQTINQLRRDYERLASLRSGARDTDTLHAIDARLDQLQVEIDTLVEKYS